MAMAAALLASQASGDVEIRGAQTVAKSYPAFFDDFKKLGGLIHE
jgi:3-phosphoshikimate 1-carboxyvinyltransferase